MEKDFRKDPRAVVSRQGDQIVVSLPDGTIAYARDSKHEYLIHNRWLGPALTPGERVLGGGIRYASLEWVDVKPWEPPQREQS